MLDYLIEPRPHGSIWEMLYLMCLKLTRYKMSTSCGGGYCDCGDSEAWSDFVHCSAHSVGAGGGLASAANEDPV
jgi:hypothetical protein